MPHLISENDIHFTSQTDSQRLVKSFFNNIFKFLKIQLFTVNVNVKLNYLIFQLHFLWLIFLVLKRICHLVFISYSNTKLSKYSFSTIYIKILNLFLFNYTTKNDILLY